MPVLVNVVSEIWKNAVGIMNDPVSLSDPGEKELPRWKPN